MLFEEEHSQSEDKPPSYIDFHTHSWMLEEDGILHLRNIFPSEADFSALPEYFSVGIHPARIQLDRVDEDLAVMDRLLAGKGAMAVGECGLDRLAPVPLAEQERIFIAQIELAQKHHVPVILHSVRCWPEVIRIKNKYAPKSLWAAHGFRGNLETAMSLIKHSILLSFGEAIVSDDSPARETLRHIPEGSFLLETDESSVSIEYMYLVAALIRQVDIEDLQSEISDTFRRLFPEALEE